MTDWDKELAKIDKQLASLPEEAVPVAPSRGGPASPAPTHPAMVAGAPMGTRAATFGLYGRLGLSVALGVGMLFWPYAARCGGGLAIYLLAVATVLTSGVWSAVWSWRHRAGRSHSLSLLLILWGLVLGAMEILPRTGYAIPTLERPAAWSCQ